MVNARECQPLLAPLVHRSFVGSYFENSCCPFTKMEWDHLLVQPEPELSANCVKPQGLDHSPRAESWIDISTLMLDNVAGYTRYFSVTAAPI